MPQATENPLNFESDSDAIALLEKANIKCFSDFVIRVVDTRKLTKDEAAAINYLVEEWDYGFERI